MSFALDFILIWSCRLLRCGSEWQDLYGCDFVRSAPKLTFGRPGNVLAFRKSANQNSFPIRRIYSEVGKCNCRWLQKYY